MKRRGARAGLAYAAAAVWLALTVSLTIWWLVFSLGQARRLAALGGEGERLSHVQRMLTWEGAVLVALLIGGGIALVIGIRRERARRQDVQDFFTSFTHDLKTALTSIRLQVESLGEDLQAGPPLPQLDRLLKDAVRLELQLDNSLFLARAAGGLLLEPVAIGQLVGHVAADWPELAVSIEGDAVVRADRRALESVLRNVLQNAATHGNATAVTATVTRRRESVRIELADNGGGLPAGVVLPADRPFARPTGGSGTGIGLFVSRRLIDRMGGALSCRSEPAAGFTVVVTLPEAR